jgi:ribose transport system permease protein
MVNETNTEVVTKARSDEAAATPPTAGRPVGAAARDRMGDGAIRAGLMVVRIGPLFMLLVLCVVMAALSPLFLTERNVTNLGFQSAAVIALALGQLVVILTRGIDISVGSIVGLTVAAGAVLYGDHVSSVLILAAMIAIGGAVGALNGLLYVKGRLPHPFIVTLATLGIIRGVAFLLTNGNILPGQPALLETIGGGQVGAVPYATLLVVVLAFVTWTVTKRMRWGRWVYAIGGNPEGAKRVGIHVDRVLIGVYIFSGLMAGIAGVITAGQTGVGDANAGLLYELQAIAAVMIGGVSFLGGRGGVSNAIVGALTVTVIHNGLNLLNVSGYWEEIAIGVIILVAVELNVLRGHFETQFRVRQAAAVEPSGAHR